MAPSKSLVLNTGCYQPKYVSVPIETTSEEFPYERLGIGSPRSLLGNSSSLSGTINLPVPLNGGKDSPALSAGCPVPLLPTASGTGAEAPAYSAIVQSIFSDVRLLGCNQKPSNDFCGKIRAKIQCSHEPGHRPYYKHEHCNDPLCPICYTKFASRIADGITDRLWGYHEIYQTPLYHLIFWGNHTNYRNMTEAMQAGNELCKKMGVTAGSIQWHPARIKEEIQEQLREYRTSRGLSKNTGFWEMAHDDVLNIGPLEAYCVRGDHFHGITSGRLRDVKAYYEDTGFGYKKVRYMHSQGEIHRLAYYLATHSAYEFSKQSVRYVGNASYAKLGKTLIDERIEDVCCDVCRARMQEMFVDSDGEPVGVSRDHITRIVRTFKYWKRKKKSRKRVGYVKIA